MEATHTAMTQKSRVIRAAAALYAMYVNSDVAAFNRARSAKTERSKCFWFAVGRALHQPPSCQCWTDEQAETWKQIRARAAISNAGAA